MRTPIQAPGRRRWSGCSEPGGDDAIYVPGHGAVVDADFIRRQRSWLLDKTVTHFNRET